MALPSKKIIALGAVCLVAIGAVIYVKASKSGFSLSPDKDLKIVKETPKTSDPVKELQKKLNATQDPNTPGTSDSSLTNTISQDFAAHYLDLQQRGVLDTESEAELLEDISSKYTVVSSITLTLKDISTFSDSETLRAKAFGNASAKAIIAYYPTLKTSPIDIIGEIQSKKSTSTIEARLQPIVRAYRSMALDLQKIAVPASFAPYYLDIVNGYIALGDDVELMSFYYSDPVKGFLGLNNYQHDLLAQAELLKNFPIYFDSNGILFSNGEEGVVWNSLEY